MLPRFEYHLASFVVLALTRDFAPSSAAGSACPTGTDQITSSKFIGSGLIPAVIDVPPTDFISVDYPGSGVSACLGNELLPEQTNGEPILHWNTTANSVYTLHMTDPDVFSTEVTINHWLVVNIQADQVSRGQTLTTYIGPLPKKAGPHRYTFLVFRQSGIMVVADSDLPAPDRTKFVIRDFAAKYQLGNPIAGNYFVAQRDQWVVYEEKVLGLAK